jgi:hypothetical protein
MGVYAKQIANLSLVKRIRKNASDEHVPEIDADLLHAMVLGTADSIGDALAQIPVTFRQYTKHDLLHARNLIFHMGKFIPANTLKILNPLELSVLVLAAMLHDLGMYVTPQERDEYIDSEAFRSFLAASPERDRAMEEARAGGRPSVARAIEDAALAEYFRKLHPERVRQNIDLLLKDQLKFGQIDLSRWVADICESHGWGVQTSTDPAHPERAVARLAPKQLVYNVPFHPQYIACCLRIADILDFDQSRTPVSLLKTITDPISQREWQRHLQIDGAEITDHTVEFYARCKHPEHYVAVTEYMDWIDTELMACRRLVTRDAPSDVAAEYTLHLPVAVDRFHITMDDPSYVAGAFRFELDYERIMRLLMDKSLYPDPSLFLRELLQNALDACRLRKALAQAHGAAYEPSIVVWDYSDDAEDPRIVLQDNGIGMSEEVVKNYFMRVGRSYYRSTEFNTQRQKLQDQGVALEATSQFGIGILSCFMVGDRLEIETYRIGDKPLEITIEGPTKYFLMKRLPVPAPKPFATPVAPEQDAPPEHAGTRLTMHLRRNTKIDVHGVLDQFSANVDWNLIIHRRQDVKTVPSWRWTADPERVFALIPETFRNVLVPEFVPLERYEFSRHLRGAAWMWFLRDVNGGLTYKRGYLELDRKLSCKGIPKEIAERGRYLESPSERTAWYGRGEESDVSRYITSLSDEAFARVADWASRVRDAPEWHVSRGCPEALMAGDESWLSFNVKYSTYLEPALGVEEHALHGIRIPAGIVSWSPMAGYGSPIELLGIPGGFQIDSRGTNPPNPAASRLFMDQSEGGKTAIPLLRAFLRHGLDLAASGRIRDGGWASEFIDTVSHSRYWLEVLEADAQELLARVTWMVLFPGWRKLDADFVTLRKFIGRYVRVGFDVPDVKAGPKSPIIFESSNAQILLFTHAIERRDDIWHVDLDRPVRRTADEFRRLRDGSE